MTTRGGRNNHRIRIERAGVDEHGSLTGAWASYATRWATYRPTLGREALEMGRLESTTTGVVTVRADSVTRGITAADRVVFLHAPYQGVIAQIRSVVPSQDRAHIEFTIETGVAT